MKKSRRKKRKEGASEEEGGREREKFAAAACDSCTLPNIIPRTVFRPILPLHTLNPSHHVARCSLYRQHAPKNPLLFLQCSIWNVEHARTRRNLYFLKRNFIRLCEDVRAHNNFIFHFQLTQLRTDATQHKLQIYR